MTKDEIQLYFCKRGYRPSTDPKESNTLLNHTQPMYRILILNVLVLKQRKVGEYWITQRSGLLEEIALGKRGLTGLNLLPVGY